MALTKVSSKTLSDNAVTSDKIAAGAISVSDMADNSITAAKLHTSVQGALGTRNLVINGDMRIAQRGTSVSGISNSADYKTVDRWRFAQQSSTGVFTMSQDTDVPVGQGFTYSVKMQCTTADTTLDVNDRIAIWQGIEGNMLQSYIKGTGATKATLSFWVKTNKTGTYNLELNDTDNIRHICNTFNVTTADTWQKITWVIPEDTGGNRFDNGINGGMYVNIVFGAGSNYQSGTLSTTWTAPVTQANRYVGASNLADSTSNYINITGVQLEVGDTATPFEHRPYDMELARCLRYFQKSFRQEDAPAQNAHSGEGEHRFTNVGGGFGTMITIYLQANLRSYPSVTTYNPHNTNNLARNTSAPGDISGLGVGNLSNNSFVLVPYGTNHDNMTGFQGSIHWTVDAEI